jgi:hypothetical protein
MVQDRQFDTSGQLIMHALSVSGSRPLDMHTGAHRNRMVHEKPALMH